MSEETILRRIIGWVTFLPVWAAYWLVWLAAKSGNPDARDVYEAMWQANLALPPLTPAHRALANAEWAAMDAEGRLPADWPERRAKIEAEFADIARDRAEENKQ